MSVTPTVKKVSKKLSVKTLMKLIQVAVKNKKVRKFLLNRIEQPLMSNMDVVYLVSVTNNRVKKV